MKTASLVIALILTLSCAHLFAAACPTGTLQDYINLGSGGCTLSTSGNTAHASAPILLYNFSYSTSVTGTATAKAASAIAVAPNPGTLAGTGEFAGLRVMSGQTTWTDPGDLAADGGTVTATLRFTASAVGFPAHGILGQESITGGLVFSAASNLKTEELFCSGALFGVGNSCTGKFFDDSSGFSLSNNRGTGHSHEGLSDPSFLPSQGVGILDVIATFTITGAVGANAGVSSYLFLLRPTS